MKKRILDISAAVIFWVVVWQLISMAVGSKVILPGPLGVIKCLGNMVVTADFWRTVGGSFVSIVSGFIIAVLTGVVLAVLSFVFRPAKLLISPMMKLVKAVPVASFIILILLWVNSKKLPTVISFLMVLPVIYINVLSGIESTDVKLLEMARVFKMSRHKIRKYIYLPAVKPYFISACSMGLGFCWKSGIAAEVIGLTSGSIGDRLYQAKLYLMTDELFAWTMVIVILSVGFEKIVMKITGKVLK